MDSEEGEDRMIKLLILFDKFLLLHNGSFLCYNNACRVCLFIL